MGGVIGNVGAAYNQQAAANTATYNAEVAKWMAGDARVRGQSRAEEMKLRGGQIEGAEVAGAAHGGVDVSSPTVGAVRGTTAMMTEYDVAKIRNNAARQAWGFENKAAEFKAAASADRFNSTMAIFGAGASAGQSVVSYGMSTGSTYDVPTSSAGGADAQGSYIPGQDYGPADEYPSFG